MEYSLKEINENQTLDIIEENMLENIDTINSLSKKLKEIEESNQQEQNLSILTNDSKIEE